MWLHPVAIDFNIRRAVWDTAASTFKISEKDIFQPSRSDAPFFVRQYTRAVLSQRVTDTQFFSFYSSVTLFVCMRNGKRYEIEQKPRRNSLHFSNFLWGGGPASQKDYISSGLIKGWFGIFRRAAFVSLISSDATLPVMF